MNSDTTFTIHTSSSAETKALAERLASHLQGGETIELVGDIGAGKTTFVQGLARAMGYADDVPSPTFTISRSYPLANRKTLHHFDLYRLTGHDIVTDELAEALTDTDAITAVEWPENGEAEAVLPKNRLQIEFILSENACDRDIILRSLAPSTHKVITGIANDYRA